MIRTAMIHTAILTTVLSFSGAAWACGEGNCDKEHCKMPKTAATQDVQAVEGTHANLTVTGMSCGSCADKIQKALLEIDGVKAANVDHATGKAEIAFDDQKTNVDALVAVVTEKGYGASVLLNN